MEKHTEDFKQEAVRIALTSGLSQRRVVADLGVGLSTLGKWISQYRPSDLTTDTLLIFWQGPKGLNRIFQIMN